MTLPTACPADTSAIGQALTDLPVGSNFRIFEIAVKPLLQKYSDFQNTQISLYPCRPVPQRGARAIVTNAGRDAVDADALQTTSADADGEVVWSRHPDAGVRSAGSNPADEGG